MRKVPLEKPVCRRAHILETRDQCAKRQLKKFRKFGEQNDMHTCMQAAKAGEGVAFLNGPMCTYLWNTRWTCKETAQKNHFAVPKVRRKIDMHTCIVTYSHTHTYIHTYMERCMLPSRIRFDSRCPLGTGAPVQCFFRRHHWPFCPFSGFLAPLKEF